MLTMSASLITLEWYVIKIVRLVQSLSTGKILKRGKNNINYGIFFQYFAFGGIFIKITNKINISVYIYK